ncbi:MAG TPA: polysaccharide deacetylase family protein [Thermoanaerobaculia bacterium]|nr:polysaccharide deacetylase family protein [Thermoanaerobaculia bacterium]
MKPSPNLRSFARGLVELSAAATGTLIRVQTGEPAVALTFDDGPDPHWTPLLLELLARYGARATFFMVGKQALAHRAVVERVAAEGHAIGNHTWDHPSFPTLRAPYRRAQLRWAREALAPWGDQLFRPPYGHQSLASQLDAVALGYRVVAWNAVAEDWLDDPAELLVARVERRLGPGSIVLFHDRLATFIDPRHADRGPTLEAVEQLLTRHAGRYRFVTVPELLALGRPRRWHFYRRPDLDWLRRLA